jgi:hypothetical protein
MKEFIDRMPAGLSGGQRRAGVRRWRKTKLL